MNNLPVLMKRPPGGFKFMDSMGFERYYIDVYRQARTERFVPVFQAYSLTMDRVTATPGFPVNLAAWLEVAFTADAAGNHPVFDLEASKHAEEVFKMGALNLETFIDGVPQAIMNEQVLIQGIQGIFYSMIMSSFVAFEALAGDLWVEAVNMAPEMFTNVQQAVTLDDLERLGDDVRGRRGDLLKAANKVNFHNLHAIKEAYHRLSLSDAYKPDDQLCLSAEVRHLIAHRSGIVDDRFLNNLRGTPLEDFKAGSQLVFDGPQVAGLINPCVKSATHLMTYMDNWASRYRTRSAKAN